MSSSRGNDCVSLRIDYRETDMSTDTILNREELALIYPESDGEPLGDSTEHLAWINLFFGNLEELYAQETNVFVASNLLWYPVEGQPRIRIAADVMVVFGRPAANRGSWLQWIEDGMAPQVVVEVRSPGNTSPEMTKKRSFYEKYGVEEYYLYDFPRRRLAGWQRESLQNPLAAIPQMNGWVSPRMGIRFEMGRGGLRIYFPDGRPFLSRQELVEQRHREEKLRRAAESRLEFTEDRIVRLESSIGKSRDRLNDLETERAQAQAEIERLKALVEEMRERKPGTK